MSSVRSGGEYDLRAAFYKLRMNDDFLYGLFPFLDHAKPYRFIL